MDEQLATQIFSSTRQVAWVGILPLAALLFAATWTDVRRHRIPNGLIASGMLLALILHIGLPQGMGFLSVAPGGLGFLRAMAGLGIAFGIFFPLYLMRAMGAGDVKLMAMVGAFLGPQQIWGALLGVALAGGVLALAVALQRGVFLRMLHNIKLMLQGSMVQVALGGTPNAAPVAPTAAKLPYGVAITAGTLAYLVYHAFGIGFF